MVQLGLRWCYDTCAVKANQNVHLLLWGFIHLAQAVVNDSLVAGELTLVLKMHWEIKHSLLWVLLAAIPLHTGSSKPRGRQRTLGDGIIHLSGTTG